MQVVSVVEEKGGVGKTTTAMSLAAICARRPERSWSTSTPHGSASWWATKAGSGCPSTSRPRPTRPCWASSARRQLTAMTSSSSIRRAALKGRQILSTVLGNSDYVIVPTEEGRADQAGADSPFGPVPMDVQRHTPVRSCRASTTSSRGGCQP